MTAQTGAIDLHCHVLAGIDDGPPTIEDSLAIARAAAAAGTHTMVATSHVCWRFRNDAATLARLVDELNARLKAEQIALEVLTGAEIAMTRIGDLDPEEVGRLTLGQGSCLLVEPPFTPILSGLEMVVYDLQRQGYRVLIAHPERCQAFHRDRRPLEAAVSAGALTSITAGSLVGRFGREVSRFALDLVRDGLVHSVASDAHDDVRRPPGVTAEVEQAGLGGLASWLTRGVPEAILAGSPIPPRPFVELPDARGGWRGLGKRRR